MTNPLLIDSNEPLPIIPMLSQMVDVDRVALNVKGFADYKWDKVDGKSKQVERKQWGEILGNIEHIEEQLQRHLTKHPEVELVLLIEGIATQAELGTQVLKQTQSGVWVRGNRYSARLKAVYSWLYQVDKYCEIMYTSGLTETAIALGAMYEADQKQNHNTFKRSIKQVDFNPNPMVTTLMGASNGLGDTRATDLINKFGTPWNIWDAGFCEHSLYTINELSSIKGIGPTIISNVLRGIGRPDV